MKKNVRTIFISIFMVIISSPVYGKESLDYFSIGSKVKQMDETTFQVATEGQKPNEGFGISAINVQGKKKVTLQSNMKGEGTILVAITELDNRGKVIKRVVSKPLVLTANWNVEQLNMKLSPKAQTIQLLFVTNTKDQQTFFIKNIRVQTEKKPTL
jgi:predicted DNA-binding ArsR family transcriptional regulator